MNIYTYEEFNKAIQEGNTVDTDSKLLRTIQSKEFLLYFKRSNDEKKTYRYLVTFTLPVNHKFNEDIVEKYIIKQLHRKPLKILQAYIVKEYTKKNTAHWHCPIETRIPLKKDRFDYYIKKYGSIDISKTWAQNLDNGIKYASKDSKARKIIGVVVP